MKEGGRDVNLNVADDAENKRKLETQGGTSGINSVRFYPVIVVRLVVGGGEGERRGGRGRGVEGREGEQVVRGHELLRQTIRGASSKELAPTNNYLAINNPSLRVSFFLVAVVGLPTRSFKRFAGNNGFSGIQKSWEVLIQK